MAALPRPQTRFSPSVNSIVKYVKDFPVVVFCGSNNSGKSITLKEIGKTLGEKFYHLQCQRFYTAQSFPSQEANPDELYHERVRYLEEYERGSQNTEQNQRELIKSFNNLSDNQEQKALLLCSELLEEKFSFEPGDPDNTKLPWVMLVNGTNIAQTSSGTRLLLTMITTLLDEKYEYVMLDEPELGLTPRIQEKIASILFDEELRDKWFPHLKRIFIATHSHNFLNKKRLDSNFYLAKNNHDVIFRQITDIAGLHKLQFNLLGNKLESLFLPPAFVVVEGKTDKAFLEYLVRRLFPDSSVMFTSGNGDGGILRKLHELKNIMGDFQKSPYRNRLVIVLDFQHSVNIPDLLNRGIPRESIHIWTKNGIENYYPLDIVSRIFNADLDSEKVSSALSGGSGSITINGITKTKDDLCSEVVNILLSHESLKLDFELIAFINLLKKVIE